MPNHLTTVCTVTGPSGAIDAFVAAHFPSDQDGDPFFDFATVIPKPEIVDATESGSEADQGFYALTGLCKVEFGFFVGSPMHLAAKHHGFELGPWTTREDYRAWLEKRNPGAIEKGRRQLQCFRETGYLNWYDWNIANWGTKWGAYGYKPRLREPQKLVIEFQTAWAFPEPVFEVLRERYPALVFDGATIDEGGPEYEWRYAADGKRFEKVEQAAERYELVYGRERDTDEEGEEASS